MKVFTMFKYQNKNYTYYHNNVVEMQKCVNESDSPELEHSRLMQLCDITICNLSDNIISHNSRTMIVLVDSLLDNKIECQLTRSNLVIPEIYISEPVLPGIDFYEPLEIVEDEPETYGITTDYSEWKKFREEFNLTSRLLEVILIDIPKFPVEPVYMLKPVACDMGTVIAVKSFVYDTLCDLLASLPNTKWYLYDLYQDQKSSKFYVRYAV